MSNRQDSVSQEAARLLGVLREMPFQECCPLSREFNELPARPGIYAIKHSTEEILYIGKSGSVRGRLRGGHKALGWAFIDRLDPDDVRIAAVTLSFQWVRLSLSLERIIIRQLRPPYNDRIAQED